MKRSLIAATLRCAVLGAHANPTIQRNGSLTDPGGRTLYTFDKDSKGSSACNGGCAAAWPPFAADKAARPQGEYSIVTRDDGSRQWAYKDMPLYFYVGDRQPGEANGDKQGGVWHVVRTSAANASAGAAGIPAANAYATPY